MFKGQRWSAVVGVTKTPTLPTINKSSHIHVRAEAVSQEVNWCIWLRSSYTLYVKQRTLAWIPPVRALIQLQPREQQFLNSGAVHPSSKATELHWAHVSSG